jgi:hypothetical protein
MKQFNTIAAGFVFSLVLLTSGLFAQNPTISIQGTLKDANGASVDDGTQSVTFRLYDDLIAGNELWVETAPVTVVGGIYSHSLGKAEPLVGADFATTVFLSVEVGGLELSPRTEMTYAPYALAVNSAQQIAQRGCSGQVGDIKYSILPPDKFATQNGECWVPMDGRDISDTRLASLMSPITTVPDMSGLFIRATEYNEGQDPDRSEMESYSLQTDDNKEHSHPLDLETSEDSGHYHITNEISLGTNFSGGLGIPVSPGGTFSQVTQPSQSEGGGRHLHAIAGETNDTGGESRPKNMNFFIYIRVD